LFFSLESTLNHKHPLFILANKMYISPQKNRAVKNKIYFYNCYEKEEEFHIKDQG
jgi:hypothetical protein